MAPKLLFIIQIGTHIKRVLKMEESQRLTLNEEAVKNLPEPKKSIFIYSWLQYLVKILPSVSKVGYWIYSAYLSRKPRKDRYL